MPMTKIEVKSFKLAHSSNDVVKIQHIEKPYGEFSSPVVNIAIFKDEDEKVSEIDIPYDNIEEFFKALNESVALADSIPRSKIHDELSASVGGGQ
ncbi:MAG: hypothetical protein ABF301_05845 [Sulfurovum sp.]|jgi:hypothetical protein|nr:MAG: Uncharacterised protein [Arcobacter lacus]